MAVRLLGALVLVSVVLAGADAVIWHWFCQIDDVTGVWQLQRDLETTDEHKYCHFYSSSTLNHVIRLSAPDIAEDEYGNYGHWTLIYGIAMEVTIHGRKYYSFFDWKFSWRTGWQINCAKLEPGTSHDILTNNYACFGGKQQYSANGTKIDDDDDKPKGGEMEDDDKTTTDNPPTFLKHDPTPTQIPRAWKLFFNREDEARDDDDDKTTTDHPPTFLKHDPTPTQIPRGFKHDDQKEKKKFRVDYDLVDRINSNDLHLWEAEAYDFLEDIKEEDLVMMAGGNMSLRARPPKPADITPEQQARVKQMPSSFDWRDVEGENYVTPVRNQGYCGSCYAFAATAAYESRIRVMTKNTVAPVLSPQDVVDCNPYSYGCSGGWIFSEGKYVEEYGFVEESCNIYNAQRAKCERDEKCQKYYGTDYQYIGGYFGGSNEVLMMEAIFHNGPIVVGFAVYHDFWYYRRGIYYHSGPDWLMGFHAVIVVGWGQDENSGTKYWIVKNSWGKRWGEDGYFRIARGNNDCDIEAESFEAFPIL